VQNKKSNHYDAVQSKKSSHFFTTFSLHFTVTFYANTTHVLFGILYHELTSQNQGNVFNFLPLVANQSRIERSSTADEDDDCFFPCPGFGSVVTCQPQLLS